MASRRGILGGLASLLAAAGIATIEIDEAEARKRSRRRKRRTDRKDNKPLKTRADASCPGPPDFGLSFPEGNVRFAQTFRARASGPLVSAELQLSKREGSEGDYLLRLSPLDGSGFPTNEVLAEASVANADVPAGGPIVLFTFTEPSPVRRGVAYALVMTRTAGDVGWNARAEGICSGRTFRSDGQTGPFDEGVGGGGDFIYTTFVRSRKKKGA
jgi:hypothetical protein